MKPEWIVWHCSDSEWGDVSVIDGWHRHRGWNGVGYHGVICNGILKPDKLYDAEIDGVFQMGRYFGDDRVVQGAHVAGMNDKALGFCLIGTTTFTDKQKRQMISVTMENMERFKIPIDRVIGHNEIGLAGHHTEKTCPNMDLGGFRQGINWLLST